MLPKIEPKNRETEASASDGRPRPKARMKPAAKFLSRQFWTCEAPATGQYTPESRNEHTFQNNDTKHKVRKSFHILISYISEVQYLRLFQISEVYIHCKYWV